MTGENRVRTVLERSRDELVKTPPTARTQSRGQGMPHGRQSPGWQGDKAEASPAASRSAASREEGGGWAGERREAESGGGRRAERLFVVRFDPEGEPETLTFLA